MAQFDSCLCAICLRNICLLPFILFLLFYSFTFQFPCLQHLLKFLFPLQVMYISMSSTKVPTYAKLV